MVPRRLRAAVLMVGALTLLLGGTALLYGEAARAAETRAKCDELVRRTRVAHTWLSGAS